MVHEPTPVVAGNSGASRFENGSPLVVVPSWLVSLVLHSLLLFLLASELKSCGDVSGAADGELLREVGIYVKAEKDTAPQESPPTGEPADTQVAMRPESPVVSDEPPVRTALPTDRPNVVGAGVPTPAASSDALPGVIQPGGRVRSAGLPPPPPGQISFFGANDSGERVVYVLDCSSSMTIANSIGVAKSELKASLRHLRPDHQFQVIFYNVHPSVLQVRGFGDSQLLPASRVNRNLAIQFIDAQLASNGTDHMPALQRALGFRPDVVFLLTDADQPGLDARDFADIRKLNKGGARIHCIEFGQEANLNRDENFLMHLAREGRGTYRYFDVTRFPRR